MLLYLHTLIGCGKIVLALQVPIPDYHQPYLTEKQFSGKSLSAEAFVKSCPGLLPAHVDPVAFSKAQGLPSALDMPAGAVEEHAGQPQPVVQQQQQQQGLVGQGQGHVAAPLLGSRDSSQVSLDPPPAAKKGNLCLI